MVSLWCPFLSRLQTELDKKSRESVKGEETFRNDLSTHPATGEGIRRILASSKIQQQR
jgi:hypothetical protein